MDPLRILARVLFAYVLLLALVRVSGKHLIKQATPFDLTLSLILGDMVDDALWADVNASVFVVGACVLVLIHTGLNLLRFRSATCDDTGS